MSSVALAWAISKLERRRLLLFVPIFLPWSILVIGNQPGTSVQFVFLWGSIDLPTLHWFPLSEYVLEYTSHLPLRLLAWPIGSLFYLGGIISTVSGDFLGREDRRITAGFLAISGLNALPFTLGMARRNPETIVAIPLGTVVLGLVAWWSYWPAMPRSDTDGRER